LNSTKNAVFGGIFLHAEGAGDLLDIAAFVVAHNEGCPLDLGELLQCRFEEINDLAALRDSLGRRIGCGNAIEPIRSVSVLVARGSLPLATRLAHTDQIEGAICGDAIEPGAERRTSVEAVELFVSAKKGFLNHVLGILFITSHTEGETEDRPAMPLD